MTNKIGPLELPNISGEISPPRVADNSLTLYGFFSTRNELNQLIELFRKAINNPSIQNMVGQIQTGFDPTEGSVLTQYCEFDSEVLRDGWYLLLSIDVSPEKYDSYYPFTISLFFLGSTSLLSDGYSVYGLDEIDSDWSI